MKKVYGRGGGGVTDVFLMNTIDKDSRTLDSLGLSKKVSDHTYFYLFFTSYFYQLTTKMV